MIDCYVRATVANGSAKTVMPISPMDSIAAIVEHGVGDIWNIVIRSAHPSGAIARLDGKYACWCRGRRFACGDDHGVNGAISLPSNEALLG